MKKRLNIIQQFIKFNTSGTQVGTYEYFGGINNYYN